MTYQVQGYNWHTQQWETLPYWDNTGAKQTEYPLEHVAVHAMWHFMVKWPCRGPGGDVIGYRVVEDE